MNRFGGSFMLAQCNFSQHNPGGWSEGKMFESLASNIITALLGEYIENVDPKSLNIAIFKGNLDLYDLKLKKTALDSFNLPVTVVQGLLGHLRLQIPWTSLETKPVIAEISDLFLVVQPRKNVQVWLYILYIF